MSAVADGDPPFNRQRRRRDRTRTDAVSTMRPCNALVSRYASLRRRCRRVLRRWRDAGGSPFAHPHAALVARLMGFGLDGVWLFIAGRRHFRQQLHVVWGFPIANYVWWIGIGNAGTLISSMLLLTRQRWRASINRFAEAMTLFAASIAGLFPIMHLGRPMNISTGCCPIRTPWNVWPQWRSALIWDFWAIASYILFSIIFFYVGLDPRSRFVAGPRIAATRTADFLRRTRARFGAVRCGNGKLYEHVSHHAMACLAVPLVVSLHSVVGLDFAASLMPRLAGNDLPALFRRRGNVFRLCDGGVAGRTCCAGACNLQAH